MKNLPENDTWKKIGERLDAYTDVPADDLWDKIAGHALPSSTSSTVSVWVDRFTMLALLVYVSFMAGYSIGSTGQPELALNMPSPAVTGKSNAEKIQEETVPGRSADQGNAGDDLSLGHAPNVPTPYTGKRILPGGSGDNENAFLQNKSLDSRKAQVGRDRIEALSENIADARQAPVINVGNNSEDPALVNVTTDSINAVSVTVRIDAAGPLKATEEKVSDDKKIRKRTQLYFTMSPALSFQKITPGHDDAINVQGLRSPGVLSQERFGLAVEIGFQRPLTKRLEAYGGVSFYQQRQQLTYEYDSPDKVVIASAAGDQYTIKPQTISRSFDYNMQNAGVAAGLWYHIKGVKLMHKLGAGLQYQKGFLRSGSEDTYDNAGSSYLNYQLAYRIAYRFSRRLNLFIQPTFTHAFYSKEKLSEPFAIKPYRASMGIGAVYRF